MKKSQIEKQTMSLTAGVNPETYYKVQDICRESGTYVSEWLNNLIFNAILEHDMQAFEYRSEVESNTPKEQEHKEYKDRPATEAQLQYIKRLSEQLGEKPPSKKLSLPEADALIKELVKRRNDRWRAYYESN